jgi:spermidine synthase
MVVTVYLAALAIGAAITEPLVRALRGRRREVFVIVQVLLALTAPITLAAIPAAGGLALNRTGLDETYIFTREYLLAAAVVFFPTVLIGMGLPLLVGMAAGEVAAAGRMVGRVYAWNSLGTIAGASLTGAVLVPLVGLRGTLLLLAAAGFAVAAWAAGGARAEGAMRRAVPVAAVVFVVLVAAAPGSVRFALPGRHEDERIIHYAEGPAAIVHVAEIGEKADAYRLLYVDSKSVAGTYEEIVTDQKMLAHLPLLLHPAPRRALTVGFGTGGTSYSMLLHAVQVDCVEIEPQVPRAADWFISENHGLVGIDRGPATYRLVLDDARAWLHVAPEKYDVIVTDVTSIQYRGNGNLYTADYFRLMQRQLAPGGLGCAWVPISGITPQQLRVLVRTFQSVFAHTSVWYMLNLPTDFVILVGAEGPLTVEPAALAARMKPGVRRDLAEMGLEDACTLVAGLLGADEAVRAYTGEGPLHTDDKPILDYLTHASPYQHTLAENLGELITMRAAGQAEAALGDCGGMAEAAQHVLAGHIAIASHTSERLPEAIEHYRAAAARRVGDVAFQRLAKRHVPPDPPEE